VTVALGQFGARNWSLPFFLQSTTINELQCPRPKPAPSRIQVVVQCPLPMLTIKHASTAVGRTAIAPILIRRLDWMSRAFSTFWLEVLSYLRWTAGAGQSKRNPQSDARRCCSTRSRRVADFSWLPCGGGSIRDLPTLRAPPIEDWRVLAGEKSPVFARRPCRLAKRPRLVSSR